LVDGLDEIIGAVYQISSVIKDGSFEVTPSQDYQDYNDGWYKKYSEIPSDAKIKISVTGYEFEFEPSRYNQVIFIIQKEGNDETFIGVK
jgi:hypothetical protein